MFYLNILSPDLLVLKISSVKGILGAMQADLVNSDSFAITNLM